MNAPVLPHARRHNADWHAAWWARATARRANWRGVLWRWGLFAPLLVAALALRLLIIPSALTVSVAPLVADEGNYFGIARALAAGQGIPDRWAWLRPPGYPLVLAAFSKWLGGNPRAPFIFQAFAGTLTVALTALLAGLLWDRRAALAACAWAALDPRLVYYGRLLHTETLYTTLAAGLAVCLVCWARSARLPGWRGWWPLTLGGILAGLAADLRPAMLTAVPLLALWVLGYGLWRARRARTAGPGSATAAARVARQYCGQALGGALLFAGLCAAVIAPVTAHNWQSYHRFIPLDTTTGYIFWLDHHDDTVDHGAIAARLGAIPNPGDRQTYAYRQGLAWVRQHPAQMAARAAVNVKLLWGSPSFVDDAMEKRPGASDLWRNAVHLLTLLSWAVLTPLALVGAWRLRRVAALAPLLLLAVVAPSIGVALSHFENRYLLPSLPVIIALAAGIVAGPLAVTWSRRRLAGALIGVIGLLFVFQQVSGAELARRATVAADTAAAQSAEWTGHPGAAAARWQAALRAMPGLSEPHQRLAQLAVARGDRDGALTEITAALDRDPDNYRARALGIRLLRDAGEQDAARKLALGGSAGAPEGLAWAWDHFNDTPSPSLALDGTDIGFTRGFYGPERGDGGRTFRWMGTRGELRLTLPAGTGSHTLALTLASPRPAGQPLDVTVIVNGRVIGHVTVRQELGWNDLRLPLPPNLARPLTIQLRAPATVLPGDRRVFGVAVAAVSVEK
jgi:4-amino-4-deoxy-L-arabinose transferase-like glycosyltransferase